MDTVNLNIYGIVGSQFCVETEDGDKVYDLINKSFQEKKKVVLSFLNVELLTTAFLNTAVGKLYKTYTEEEIKAMLSVSDLNNAGAVSLKRVVETAKQFYKNPDAMKKSIDDILENE